jgi:flagellar protein FliO/FliZ
MKNKNMQIVETMRLTNNKYLQIVKVAEEYLVISISKDHVELLTRLDPESGANIRLPEEKPVESFQEILKKLGRNKK